MNVQKKFDKIVQDIKTIKIQGAKNVAKSALEAYSLIPTKKSKKILLRVRPTEPLLWNLLKKVEKFSKKDILNHLDFSQDKINKYVFDLIKNNQIIFTHCHSTSVVRALIFSKRKGKNFEVYNTETRPLFQGRKTSKELRDAGIKVTLFVDSALGVALSKSQGTKKADLVLLGADALTKKGIINKIGSGVICQIAKNEKIPVYIVADSWKFTKKKVPKEQRKLNEVWDSAPKKIKIKNPAFEFVDKKYIQGIISEFGIQNYKSFLKKVNPFFPQRFL
jgi:ribose 1,5-bisphosphate isomerase